MVSMRIQTTGIRELEARLGSAKLANEAFRVFGSRALRTGRKTAIQAIDGGTGVATQSIRGRYEVVNARVWIRSMMRYERAISIEEGRPPGQVPSLGALIRWKEAVGYPGSARELQAYIRRHGVKGKRFIGQVHDRWLADMPRWMDEAARRIERRLARGK